MIGVLGVRQQKLKRLITSIMFTLALLTPTHTPPPSTFTEFGGVMSDQYYIALARCETGGSWDHSTRSYTGGLGLSRRTAQVWGGTRNVANKTPRQQVAIADRIAFRGFQSRTRFVWPVGVYGWGCVKNQPKLQRMICNSTHPLVKRWKRNC